MMMAPAVTLPPSYTLTPSRWAAESRPLRVEPPPLVLDMSGLSCGCDRRDLDRRVPLTMTPVAALVGLVLVGEAPDLGPLGVAHDAGQHGRGGQVGPRRQHLLAVDHEHGCEREVSLIGFERDALDVEALALG